MPQPEPKISAEDLATVRKVAAEVGAAGLRTHGEMRAAGADAEEIARALNENGWVRTQAAADDFAAFHEALEGTREPTFWLLVLRLLDLGHTIPEAVRAVRDHRETVLAALAHHNYRAAWQMVRRWWDADRHGEDFHKRLAEDYRDLGPSALSRNPALIELVQRRIEDAEKAERAADGPIAEEAARHAADLAAEGRV